MTRSVAYFVKNKVPPALKSIFMKKVRNQHPNVEPKTYLPEEALENILKESLNEYNSKDRSAR